MSIHSCGYFCQRPECIKAQRDEFVKRMETADEPVAIDGNTSDGYHTFNELYEFRKAYNAALFNEWAASGKCSTHKSWRHHDGKLCFGGGWFIVVAVLPSGQISNHYEAKDWDLFAVPETERALFEFDGHTGSDVVARLKAYKTRPVAQLTDEHISAKLDRLLWEYIYLQALYPEHKPDPRTWPHVMAYAPADEPANLPPPEFEWAADGIEIGHDMFGGVDIRLDGEFVYVHINYDYRYTDNATRQRLAEQIVGLLTSPQPTRGRVVFPTMLRKMWTGTEVQAWLDENVNEEKNHG